MRPNGDPPLYRLIAIVHFTTVFLAVTGAITLVIHSQISKNSVNDGHNLARSILWALAIMISQVAIIALKAVSYTKRPRARMRFDPAGTVTTEPPPSPSDAN